MSLDQSGVQIVLIASMYVAAICPQSDEVNRDKRASERLQDGAFSAFHSLMRPRATRPTFSDFGEKDHWASTRRPAVLTVSARTAANTAIRAATQATKAATVTAEVVAEHQLYLLSSKLHG